MARTKKSTVHKVHTVQYKVARRWLTEVDRGCGCGGGQWQRK